MKRLTRFLMIISVLALGGMLFANTPPTVTNVSASQRMDGSRIVDIWYSVNDADNDTLTVSLAVSNDNGATFNVTPSQTNLSGAIGENILSGSNKHIVWNAGNEGIAFNGSQFRVKVTAIEKINLSFGLVAYYPFNGNANDESGNGHNGSINDISFSSDRFGNNESVAVFNGSSSFVVANGTGLPLNSANRTICCWVKLSSYSEYESYFLGYGGWGQLDEIYGMSCHSSFDYKLMFSQWGSQVTSTSSMSIDQWYFCCATTEGNTVNVYLNGVLESTGTININTTSGDILMGSCYYLPGHYLNGFLDDCRIYDRALSNQEILSLYHYSGWPVIHPIEMVDVQGGTFQMGEVGIAEPVHSVTVSSFQMAKSEITQAQWQEVMGNNPSYLPGYPNRPVEQVTWLDCISFCNALSVKEGLNPCYSWNGEVINCDFQANGYRLPTEAEWEFAARGGTLSLGYTYSGSNDVNSVAWYEANSDGHSHDVMTKPPNELNLYDMSGNVWEWCWDSYSAYVSGSQTNPTGAPLSAIKTRRGGSWHYVPGDCMCSFRWPINQVDSFNWLGFRICRSNR